MQLCCAGTVCDPAHRICPTPPEGEPSETPATAHAPSRVTPRRRPRRERYRCGSAWNMTPGTAGGFSRWLKRFMPDVAHEERDSIAQGEVVGVVLADGSGRAVGRAENRAGAD